MEHSKLIILICILTTCFLKTSNAQSDCWSNGFYNRPAKETSGGRYREPNYVASHPYTVFDKRKTGWTLSSNITEIRQMLMYEEEIPEIDREFLNLYSALYNFAMQPYSSQTIGGGSGSSDGGGSTLASWAKANAFCYLIKLNASAEDISSYTDTLNLLKEHCLTAFENMNVKVINCVGLEEDCKNLLHRSREVVAWAQAYDLMKASGILANNDKSVFCNPRNKLRLLARNFYNASEGNVSVIENPIGWKKNHGAISSAANLIVATVLNEAGANWLRYNYRPNKWAALGLYGLEENIFTGFTLWPRDNRPLTNSSGTAGWSEGENYMAFSMNIALPAFRAQKNFTNQNNFMDDERIHNLIKWFVKNQQPNGSHLGRDNGSPLVTNIFGLTGNPYFNPKHYGAVYIPNHLSGLDLRADYIAMLTPRTQISRPSVSVDVDGGSSYIRYESPLEDQNKHMFNLLHETGHSIDKPDYWGNNHEDDDFGSWSITADDNKLIIDPGYGAYENIDQTKNIEHHNFISLITDTTNNNIYYPDNISILNSSFDNSSVKNITASLSFPLDLTISPTLPPLQKNITAFVSNDMPYYITQDRISPSSHCEKIKLSINGNGNIDSGTYVQYTNAAKWSKYNLWHMYARFEPIDSLTFSLKSPYTGSALDGSGTWNYLSLSPEIHTRLSAESIADDLDIQTIYFPHEPGKLPIIDGGRKNGIYAYTNLKYLNDDSCMNVHMNINYSHTSSNQVLHDPFSIGASDSIETQSKHCMLSMAVSDQHINKVNQLSGYCPAQTHFRQAHIDNDFMTSHNTYLKYNNQIYIATTDPDVRAAGMVLQKKHTYEAYVSMKYNTSSSGYIDFYIPDVTSSIPMKIRNVNAQGLDGLLTTWNSATQTMRVYFTDYQPGMKLFYIEPEDPCAIACNYPDLDNNTLIIADGSNNVLTSDWKITRVGGSGQLDIKNGSEVELCEDITLHSNSVINLKGITKQTETQSEPLRSRIIVNNRAALVLDSQSVTKMDINSEILVRAGGTLVVRKNAKLLIGGNTKAYNILENAIVTIESGAFLAIEDSAIIEFVAFKGEQEDKNEFIINDGANASVNTLGANGKFLTDSIFESVTATAFCDIRQANTPHGINNREFGWCSYNQPVSYFKLYPSNEDTLCSTLDVMMDARQSLNEIQFKYRICLIDTMDNCVGNDLSVPTSGWHVGRIGKIDLYNQNIYHFVLGYRYKIQLWVENQCNEIDSFTRIVYFAPSPTALIDTTQRVFCPGYGTVVLDGSQSEYSNTHIWSVSEVIDDSLFDEMTTPVLEEEWEIAGSVSASFNFPGFKFEGGKSYIISLEVNNSCGTSEDTFYIYIPLGAKIDFANVTVYHPNIGESSIQLNSIVSGQTSFEWTPHDGLSDPYITNPIAEPNEDIVYVLWASDGVCDDYDTIEVKFNEFANAGDDRTICYGGSTELGYYDNLGLEWIWHPDIEINNTAISYPVVTPTVNRTYNVIVTKIENNEVIIETDEVNVYVDSILDVTFEKQQQSGWSVRFLNTTLKINPETTFSWDFDGLGTSTERSPWFTFPSVETDYEVCLSITNACDTYTECQSIYVDSLGGGFLGKRDVNDNPNIIDKPIANEYSKQHDGQFGLYPNPAKSFTIAKYAINQYGSIDVYNSTGKLVKSIHINPNYDESRIDLTGFSAGIYTCKIQVEGMPSKMLKLVKMH